ncbi:hypothetical protein MKW92_007034, partial [Papaver armeniacum]
EPVIPGCFLRARAIVLMPMIDQIIAVCADDHEFRHYWDIKELAPHRLQEIRRFFEDCIQFNIPVCYPSSSCAVLNGEPPSFISASRYNGLFLSCSPAEASIEAISYSMDLYASYIVEGLRQ